MKTRRTTILGLVSCAACFAGCEGRLSVLEPVTTDAGTGGSGMGDSNTSSPPPDADTPAGNCSDEAKNSDETDIDCGGPLCAPCPIESSCARHADCESGVCRAATCQEPACDDGQQNGDEGGIDCGGSCASQCETTLRDCNCAASPALQPLACGGHAGHGELPSFLSANGAAAAFSFCNGSCDAYYWNAEGSQRLAVSAEPKGLSSAGNVVLVNHLSPRPTYPSPGAFVWQPGESATELPLPSAYQLSADGRTALALLLTTSNQQLALWTRDGDTVPLGSSSAYYINRPVMTPDGAIVITQEQGSVSDVKYVRFDASGQQEDLGLAMPGDVGWMQTRAISSAGTVMIGHLSRSVDDAAVFLWSAAEGLVELGPLNVYDLPMWLSPDGSLAFGTLQPVGGSPPLAAFRWTAATGAVALFDTPLASVFEAASTDGSVAVGYTGADDEAAPFVWTAASGMRSLSELLADSEVDLAGWQLSTPLAVSGDGRVVLGEGTCGGVPAVFRAALP